MLIKASLFFGLAHQFSISSANCLNGKKNSTAKAVDEFVSFGIEYSGLRGLNDSSLISWGEHSAQETEDVGSNPGHSRVVTWPCALSPPLTDKDSSAIR